MRQIFWTAKSFCELGNPDFYCPEMYYQIFLYLATSISIVSKEPIFLLSSALVAEKEGKINLRSFSNFACNRSADFLLRDAIFLKVLNKKKVILPVHYKMRNGTARIVQSVMKA